MEPSQPVISPQPSQMPMNPTPPARSRWWIVIVVIVALIVSGLAAAWFLMMGSSSPKKTATSLQAEQVLYDALAKAAAQPKLRVGMYRATFATKAAAEAGTSPAGLASTVSEIDIAAGDYRSVYVYKRPGDKVFTSGRCIKTQDWRDFRPDAQRPTTFKAAQDLSHIQQSTEKLSFTPCPGAGVYPNGLPDLAAARLSDGVMPVTLTASQADAWKLAVKQASLFTVKDEGKVTRDSRQLRKISFTPKGDNYTTNEKLYDAYYRAADIAGVKASGTKAAYLYQFLSVGISNTGGIEGYYLIDEQTGLPVYSELHGLAADRVDGGSTAGYNLARTKQSYSYPATMSMDTSTPLEFLE